MPIQVDNLVFKYMKKTPLEQEALHHINLTIQEGEFVGLIGRTGSGKSTLIQQFNGLLKPDSGSVLIDDISTTGKELKELRKKVGLVFQFPEYQLFEETVYRDIAYGISKLGLEEKEIRQRVLKAADAVGIPEGILEKSPFELSGGQKRRVAIAGVIVMQTKYLIMDEPGSGLDPAGKEEILNYVSKLHRDYGTAVVLVSHNMEDIAKYVERVLVMDGGRIVMDDTPGKVFLRTEELEKIGLRPPDIQYFIRKIKKIFPDFDDGVMTPDKAADELERWFLKAGLPQKTDGVTGLSTQKKAGGQ